MYKLEGHILQPNLQSVEEREFLWYQKNGKSNGAGNEILFVV